MLNFVASDDVVFPENKEAERARRVEIYAEQYEGHLQELGVTVPDGQRTGPVCRPIYCPDIEPKKSKHRDGPAPAASFFSPVAAAKYFGTARHNILKAVREGTRCQGRYFFAIDGAPQRLALRGNERGVTCLELDIDFETLSEAARWAGVATSTMFYRVRDGNPCGRDGYTFAYFDHATDSAATKEDLDPPALAADEEVDLVAYFGPPSDPLVPDFLADFNPSKKERAPMRTARAANEC